VLFGCAKIIPDARFHAMSKYQGLRHFTGGISGVSQSGKELKHPTQALAPLDLPSADLFRSERYPCEANKAEYGSSSQSCDVDSGQKQLAYLFIYTAQAKVPNPNKIFTYSKLVSRSAQDLSGSKELEACELSFNDRSFGGRWWGDKNRPTAPALMLSLDLN
jgi:hypothetical protein